MPTIKHIYDREGPGTQEAVAPEIQALRDLVDTGYRIPEWMLSLRPTLDKGYVVPDPMKWNRVRDILAIEFQKYLIEDTPAEEALARAERQIAKLYE